MRCNGCMQLGYKSSNQLLYSHSHIFNRYSLFHLFSSRGPMIKSFALDLKCRHLSKVGFFHSSPSHRLDPFGPPSPFEPLLL